MKGENKTGNLEVMDVKALVRRASILKRRMRSAQRSNLAEIYDEAAAEYNAVVKQLEAKRSSHANTGYKTAALYRAST